MKASPYCIISLHSLTLHVLLVQPIDKQSLLDSGIFCCLIHILNAILDPSPANQRQKTPDMEELSLGNKDHDGDVANARQLEVVFSVVLFVLITVNYYPVILV